MRQIIVDTETTGLEPKEGHRIIEIGCIELIKRKFTGNNFHIYINPEREVDAGALKIHGITNTFLANKPTFVAIYNDLRTYLDGAELIIHNAPFDVGFLNHEFMKLNPKHPSIEKTCKIVDTLTMARKMHPGQRNSLDALCKRYQIDNSNRKLHGALLDAEILARVYLAMTGGQSTLFDLKQSDNDKTVTDASSQIEKINIVLPEKIWDLPVVNATAEEVTTHQAYLREIKQEEW